MGKLYTSLEDPIIDFIRAQHMFFVATAPSDTASHVNLSPKGLDSFRILSPTTVGYLDFVGSGAETIAHVRDNGRIVLMFCAFEGPPKIVRLYGRGQVIEKNTPRFTELSPTFPTSPMARAILLVELTRIADSCGYAVPVYEFKKDRTQLEDWAVHKGEAGLDAYQREKNATSIDGLPALEWNDTAS